MPTVTTTQCGAEEREFHLYAAAIEESFKQQQTKMYVQKSPIDKKQWNKAARKKHFWKQKRNKVQDRVEDAMAFVARTVTHKEYQHNSKALSALVTEWDKLRSAKVWKEYELVAY